MVRRRFLAGVAAALAVVGSTVLGGATALASTPPPGQPMITWHACPNYSDEILRWLGFQDLAWFPRGDGSNRLWDNQCPAGLRPSPQQADHDRGDQAEGRWPSAQAGQYRGQPWWAGR
jgi:hypothetical protein